MDHLEEGRNQMAFVRQDPYLHSWDAHYGGPGDDLDDDEAHAHVEEEAASVQHQHSLETFSYS